MAALAEMGEVDEMVHSNEESIKGGASLNGDSCDFKDDTVNSDSNDTEIVHDSIDINDSAVISPSSDDSQHETLTNHNENLDEEKTDDNNTTNDSIRNISLLEDSDSADNEIEQITHDEHLSNGILEEKDNFSTKDVNSIVINDSGENDDVLVIDDRDDRDPIENGSIHSSSTSNRSTPSIDEQVLEDNKYKKPFTEDDLLRCTLRKNNEKSYDEVHDDEIAKQPDNDESESDIEEVVPEDPLADVPAAITTVVKKSSAAPIIVVKNTKSLSSISAVNSSTPSKNPTVVIIDTNSILSGHGPIPVVHKPPKPPTLSNTFPILPMALPAQGLYPANMRATITPIPSSTPSVSKSTLLSQSSQKQGSPALAPSPPVLPTLTDDMYVVEAPSFIVPYVYEKPPVNDLKDIVKNLETELKESKKLELKENAIPGEKEEDANKDESKDGEEDGKEKPIDVDNLPIAAALAGTLKKAPVVTYFDSPLGKFFIGIGANLVQEQVQNDLLKQQKKKRDRESGSNVETLRTISSLLKNLEYTKENNEPFRMETKKCEYCSFRTESALAMAFHLETPHMKNYVYKCNFCPFEVRSPHDILYHMEVQHGVRGRLERAPAFHQCPNCPFEDNQKGKLSRHLVTCARKFKPERNLEPPIDYEPPAKIPRAPRMKQGLGPATAVYQAMARSPQFQMLSKVSTPATNVNSLNRNRGRPTLTNVPPPIKPINIRSPPSMIFKPTSMSGGSVLLPSNYQMTGNQVYQVVGGAELGCRLGPGGSTAYLPSISTTSNCMSMQSTQQQPTSQHNLITKAKSSQPSISITPLPRGAPPPAPPAIKPGEANSKNSFVICEICDGYIKDLEQLRNHMQWIHKVKIHPKMIYNRPPLNCQKCQFRFFTDQGLERHLLGSHGLVTSSMQEAANKSKDSGRCPVCGRVYQWKLLNHVARDHNMSLKPAHLSYKCTVCTATFGMYKQFESHVYSAHSVVAKRAMDKKNATNSTSSITINKNDSSLKPLKINDEITIIPQPAKPSSEDSTPSTSGTSVTIRNSIGQSNGSEIHEVEDDSPSGSSLSKRRKVSPTSDN